jgi:hypothetical protein
MTTSAILAKFVGMFWLKLSISRCGTMVVMVLSMTFLHMSVTLVLMIISLTDGLVVVTIRSREVRQLKLL